MMMCTLYSTSLPLLPRLYIPDIPHNQSSIQSLLTEGDGLCGVLLSIIISDLESSAFNKGYIQLFTIQLLRDYKDTSFNTDKHSHPVILFPSYLSNYYNISNEDVVLLHKCQLPRLTKVVLSFDESLEWERDSLLQLVSSQCSTSPITCQTQSTMLLSVPDKREIAPVEQTAVRCLATRVVCTGEFTYGYIDPRTELNVEIEPVKKLGMIRFLPHGYMDSCAIMLNQRDAALLGVARNDWVEIEIKRTLINNVFDGSEWFNPAPVDLELHPIKRRCYVVILHERETVCLRNCIRHHVSGDIDRGSILCYVATQILITDSPLHPDWFAFYGDIVKSTKPEDVASFVSLRQLMTPDLDTTDTFLRELEKYFQTPRLIREGDILCLKSLLTGELLYYQTVIVKVKDTKDNANRSVLPQGSSGIRNRQVWVTNDDTTLTQEGHTSAFTAHCYSFDNFYGCPFPYGLDKSLVYLLRFVYPLLCMSSNPHANLNNGILIEGKPGSGKATLAKAISRLFSMHFMFFDCHEIVTLSHKEADNKLVALFSSALRSRPCVLFLSSLQVLTQNSPDDISKLRISMYLAEVICEYKKKEGLPLVIIGGTHSIKKMLPSIRSAFLNTITMSYLKPREVCEILRLMTSRWVFEPGFDLELILKDCYKLLLGDMQYVTQIANLNAVRRTTDLLSEIGVTFLPCHNLSVVATADDMTQAFKQLWSDQGDTMGQVEIPKVNWDDIGGLEGVKEEITNSLSFTSGEMSAVDLSFKRCGLLLYGPPGCGKTMMAKAIATEMKCRFLNVKGPELLDKYVGESEANMREVFDQAIEYAPCIVFFDEVDSLAPRRGEAGDSGGVMDRMTSQLLTELDRVAQTPNIYVVAATNRLDLLDPALLRPGRLDKSIEVGYSKTPKDIEKVFKAITKKFELTPEVDFSEMSRSLEGSYSGSQIYSICYDAMMNGVYRKVDELKREGKPDDYVTTVINKEDFDLALSKFKEKND